MALYLYIYDKIIHMNIYLYIFVCIKNPICIIYLYIIHIGFFCALCSPYMFFDADIFLWLIYFLCKLYVKQAQFYLSIGKLSQMYI